MTDFIVAKTDCKKTVLIDDSPSGPTNQPLPVTPGVHIVALDCDCDYTPASVTVTVGDNPLEAPCVAAFTCGKAAV